MAVQMIPVGSDPLVAVDWDHVDRPDIVDDWHTWLSNLFPEHVERDFAPYHVEFWAWVWGIEASASPCPFVAIWPRGFGKSTSVELACAMLAGRRTRRYALYVSESQEQADDHVSNVAELLESDAFATAYPDAASRKLGKYGHSRGWRRNRLRTASGFTLDALGLDTNMRGIKLEGDRPDLIILDDIDGELDSAATTANKITKITRKLFPAGSDTPAVLAVQNLVIPDGVFAQLADGRADFLANRIVSGPHPAIAGATFEQRDGRWVITEGTSTWPAISIATLQEELDRIGVTAFRAEKQHEVEPPAGGMFDHLEFHRCRWNEVPDLVRVAVWVDPAVTNKDQSDSMGIQADGLAEDGTIYRLYSWENRTTPQDALMRAIRKAIELGSLTVGVETDQGGDTWESVFEKAVDRLVEAGEITRDQAPTFISDKAGAGHGPKVERASRMLAAYERSEIVHVLGTHGALERALRRFPKSKPFDLVDAAYWSWHDLMSNTVPVVAPVSMEQLNTWDMGG